LALEQIQRLLDPREVLLERDALRFELSVDHSTSEILKRNWAKCRRL
jgi:hypothetical protein